MAMKTRSKKADISLETMVIIIMMLIVFLVILKFYNIAKSAIGGLPG